jgi:GTP-binding protein YchF
MECGLIGLQGVGKTTLFQALTAHAVPVQVGSMKPNVGIATMPDLRLERIAEFIPPEKLIPATVQVVDIPGVPSGGGAASLNQVLAHIRNVDAIVHVVNCWESRDAAVDIASMDAELILTDLVVVEGAVDKATRMARTGDADAKKRLAVLERVQAALLDEKPIRDEQWDAAERALLKSYGFMSAKPMLLVANTGEGDVAGESAAAAAVHAAAKALGTTAVTVCALIESEIAELAESDRAEMLASMGIDRPAIGVLAAAMNVVLGLSTFYTAGEKEVRAWPIPQGAPAPEAAGTIHSDIQRGFIRAECYHCDDLFEFKTEKAIKEAGKLRSEGKGYAMQDGDVVHFLFNV